MNISDFLLTLCLPSAVPIPSPLPLPLYLLVTSWTPHLFISSIDCTPNLLFKPFVGIFFRALWFCGGFCLKVMLFLNLVSDLICQVHVFFVFNYYWICRFWTKGCCFVVFGVLSSLGFLNAKISIISPAYNNFCLCFFFFWAKCWWTENTCISLLSAESRYLKESKLRNYCNALEQTSIHITFQKIN